MRMHVPCCAVLVSLFRYGGDYGLLYMASQLLAHRASVGPVRAEARRKAEQKQAGKQEGGKAVSSLAVGELTRMIHHRVSEAKVVVIVGQQEKKGRKLENKKVWG
ncbi:uncharacterized protein K452DRAFT_289408, partial [Aplosporella prunicola CBS 121167]